MHLTLFSLKIECIPISSTSGVLGNTPSLLALDLELRASQLVVGGIAMIGTPLDSSLLWITYSSLIDEAILGVNLGMGNSC